MRELGAAGLVSRQIDDGLRAVRAERIAEPTAHKRISRSVWRQEALATFLIVDDHPSRCAKKLKSYVESLQGRNCLFFLSSHSPELNSDELVWNDVKPNAVGRTLV